MFSSQLLITIDLKAEYSVCSCVSSTDQNRWNCKMSSYHFAADSIPLSGWFPTTWSIKSRFAGGLKKKSFVFFIQYFWVSMKWMKLLLTKLWIPNQGVILDILVESVPCINSYRQMYELCRHTERNNNCHPVYF